jgi:hypothetical protein
LPDLESRLRGLEKGGDQVRGPVAREADEEEQ